MEVGLSLRSEGATLIPKALLEADSNQILRQENPWVRTWCELVLRLDDFLGLAAAQL